MNQALLEIVHSPAKMHSAVERWQFIKTIRTGECHIRRISDKPSKIRKLLWGTGALQ